MLARRQCVNYLFLAGAELFVPESFSKHPLCLIFQIHQTPLPVLPAAKLLSIPITLLHACYGTLSYRAQF